MSLEKNNEINLKFNFTVDYMKLKYKFIRMKITF